MNFRVWALALACMGGFGGTLVQAQAARQADFIVAVVNSEPITNSEVRAQVQRVTAQMAQQGRKLPAADELQREVLEGMINERAQLQLARELGIRVDDAAVDQAELMLANQSQMDVAELRRRLAKDGTDLATFRSQLRDQVLISRLHEREVESRIRISDQDIDRYLQEQLTGNTDPFSREINLAQLLIAVPEKATAEQAAVLYQQAKKVLGRIRAGEDFNRLVQELSAADRSNGGQIGLRRADRYPPAFVLATQAVEVGGVSEIVRTGAGFHILKVLERRAPSVLVQTVVQSHARHILLRTSPQLTQAQAVARLADYKQRIQAGKADFQSLAREFSQDGSAADGGDLGWVMPGSFVPEFEEVMNRLSEGEISNPIVSRFGVHLIQLVERRRVDLSQQQMRQLASSKLRAARYAEAYALWARDVRERAYVEMRDAPQ
ncbi:MAG: peptidylprolyl isomerase [Burkholderiales bacterium]|nr:peptidylprolyl isomerase [Burkholderiales bacterium]